jgi:hypothetical protein
VAALSQLRNFRPKELLDLGRSPHFSPKPFLLDPLFQQPGADNGCSGQVAKAFQNRQVFIVEKRFAL